MAKNEKLAQEIYNKAIECGFSDCGIVLLSDLDGFQERLDQRTEAIPPCKPFYDKSMYRQTHIPEFFPWAKSLIVLTYHYGKYRCPESLQGKHGKSFILSPVTKKDSEAYAEKLAFEAWLKERFGDADGGDKFGPGKIAPLRYAAEISGLGIVRKNNFLYTEQGSWFELEGYFIDEECELKKECHLPPCPDDCDRCIKACKTHALCAPYTTNPVSCVSFWNTFGGGNTPGHLQDDMFSEWIIGCDNCQDACPFNEHDWSKGEDFPGLADVEELLQPEGILAADDETLATKIIPKTIRLSRETMEVIRIDAKRSIANREAAK